MKLNEMINMGYKLIDRFTLQDKMYVVLAEETAKEFLAHVDSNSELTICPLKKHWEVWGLQFYKSDECREIVEQAFREQREAFYKQLAAAKQQLREKHV